jgi:hypothetical protein
MEDLTPCILGIFFLHKIKLFCPEIKKKKNLIHPLQKKIYVFFLWRVWNSEGQVKMLNKKNVRSVFK